MKEDIQEQCRQSPAQTWHCQILQNSETRTPYMGAPQLTLTFSFALLGSAAVPARAGVARR